MLVLPFPVIDPAVFTLDLGFMTVSLRWYALAYIVGLLIGWRIVVALVKRPALWPGRTPPMRPDQPEELLTWMVLGVVLVWTRVHGAPLLPTGDAVACAAPPGIFLGRCANFINGELWGRPTDFPWAMVFPDPRAGGVPRHPSQLYEAALEGLLLGLVMLWLVRRGWLKRPGALIGVFFAGYGGARALVENFRQGDVEFVTPGNPYGHIWRFGEGPDALGLTMGQILSLPMVAIGLLFLAWAFRPRRATA